MPRIVQPLNSIQYDGTNGSYIVGTWCTGIQLVSDTGIELSFTGDGTNYTVQVGEWLVVWGTQAFDPMIFTQAQYESRYYELPE